MNKKQIEIIEKGINQIQNQVDMMSWMDLQNLTEEERQARFDLIRKNNAEINGIKFVLKTLGYNVVLDDSGKWIVVTEEQFLKMIGWDQF